MNQNQNSQRDTSDEVCSESRDWLRHLEARESREWEEACVVPIRIKRDIWEGLNKGDIYYTVPAKALGLVYVGWAAWINSKEELDRLIEEDKRKEADRNRKYERSDVCGKLRRAVLCGSYYSRNADSGTLATL